MLTLSVMRRRRLRFVIPACVLFALLAGSLPTVARVQPAQACDDPTRSLSLFAKPIGKNRFGYGLTPKDVSIPGPTIEMTEGECIQITLVNDTKRKLSMHAHGVAYSTGSDGTSLNKSCVPAGRSRTFVFLAPQAGLRVNGTFDPGSAGYWHYHDHCMGTPHGTGGINSGLFGALIVRRADDPRPDKPPFVVVFKGRTINLKKAPHTPVFNANQGQRVEFVVITHGEMFHTFHLHGHRWVDNRTGTTSGPTTDALIDNRTVGPADSFGFQVVAGEHVGPGAWMYHCHVQGHSDAGMTGIFMVKTPGGQAVPPALGALRAWRRTHARQLHH
jgi:FtsP/CotA-like multicopper oxidase with cupredoxin domain